MSKENREITEENIVEKSKDKSLDSEGLLEAFKLNKKMIEECSLNKRPLEQAFQILKNLRSLHETCGARLLPILSPFDDEKNLDITFSISTVFGYFAEKKTLEPKKPTLSKSETQEVDFMDKDSYLKKLFPKLLSTHEKYELIRTKLRIAEKTKIMIDIKDTLPDFEYAIRHDGMSSEASELARNHVIDCFSPAHAYAASFRSMRLFPESILKNYILYADIADITKNKENIQNFITTYLLNLSTIFEGFDLKNDLDLNDLKLIRAVNNGSIVPKGYSKPQASDVLEMVSTILKKESLGKKELNFCQKVTDLYVFNFADDKIREQIEKMESELQTEHLKKFKKEALRNYIEKTGDDFEKLERNQKEQIFRLALELKDEHSIIFLALSNNICLNENIDYPEREFFEELIGAERIIPKSIRHSDIASLNTYLEIFLRLQPNYWDNKSVFLNFKDTMHGQYWARVQESIDKSVPFAVENPDKLYLSTDLKSIKSLYEKGLLNLDQLTMYQDVNESKKIQFPEGNKASIADFIKSKDLGERITTAAKAGNVIFLEQMKEKNGEQFDSAIKKIENFDEILKKGVEKVLKSKNVEEIEGKIDEDKRKEVGLGTRKELNKFVREPSNFIEKIAEIICKLFLSENYKYENKSQKLIKNFSPDPTPSAKERSSAVIKPSPK